MSRVVRFNYWLDPAFDRVVGAAPDVTLQTCAMQGDDDATWTAQAQVLQILAPAAYATEPERTEASFRKLWAEMPWQDKP